MCLCVQYEIAYDVFRCMEHDGICPDGKTYETIVYGCSKGGLLREAVQLVEQAFCFSLPSPALTPGPSAPTTPTTTASSNDFGSTTCPQTPQSTSPTPRLKPRGGTSSSSRRGEGWEGKARGGYRLEGRTYKYLLQQLQNNPDLYQVLKYVHYSRSRTTPVCSPGNWNPPRGEAKRLSCVFPSDNPSHCVVPPTKISSAPLCPPASTAGTMSAAATTSSRRRPTQHSLQPTKQQGLLFIQPTGTQQQRFTLLFVQPIQQQPLALLFVQPTSIQQQQQPVLFLQLCYAPLFCPSTPSSTLVSSTSAT
eukprot:GHVS01082862.1.p1 GENE.GHVS01082862.1~~GHVS01082862.1.p1  ORF type:complete len:306 (-),score=60.35 GHVS01082862.1:2655-3572(-)